MMKGYLKKFRLNHYNSRSLKKTVYSILVWDKTCRKLYHKTFLNIMVYENPF